MASQSDCCDIRIFSGAIVMLTHNNTKVAMKAKIPYACLCFLLLCPDHLISAMLSLLAMNFQRDDVVRSRGDAVHGS
eukprot:1116193-Amphidinium_carterae.1